MQVILREAMTCNTLLSSLAVVGILMIWYTLSLKSTKESFMIGSMGLSNRRRRRRIQSHSVLKTSDFKSLEDYYKLLRRDVRQTYAKIGSVFERNGITMETVTQDSIGLAHLEVIYSHERKLYSLPRALLVALIRFISVSNMYGTLDHFYIDGKLVAFSHTIIKGNTLRAMWFYQKAEASKFLIWFYAVKKAIARSISTPGVEFVDLGPSYNEKVKEAKQKLNFDDVQNWKEVCDYSGDFKTPVDPKSV